MKINGGIALLFIVATLFACNTTPRKKINEKQNLTDVSLFLKSDSTTYLEEVVSASGDMYTVVGHHGPAVENENFGLRFFFNPSTAIDVYSKKKPGLELKKFLWYPTLEQQANGAGMDMYKVGPTGGLGGVRLWDGEKIVIPDPVSERIAKVGKGDNFSFMEMISKGVKYKGEKVDIKVRVTVFSGKREALVEAEEMNGKMVQFATGINYHKGNVVWQDDNYIAVWGVHPEDIAGTPVDMGAAILFDNSKFNNRVDDGAQVILISKPTVNLKTTITSSTSNEKEYNTKVSFINYVKSIEYY